MKQDNSGLGHFEPELTRTFLPGCAHCGAAHPLARKPAQPDGTCPDCGKPSVAAGRTISEKAVIVGGGASGFVAKSCFKISEYLINLAKRI
jgi:hypothetical protein